MESKYIRVEGLKHISEVIGEADVKIVRAMKGLEKPFVTRWKKLNDKIVGFYPGDQVVITARPAVGKSAVGATIFKDMFELPANNIPAVGAYFSLEMPNYQQILRWYSQEHKIETKAIRNSRDPIPMAMYEDMQSTGKILSGLPVYMRDFSMTTDKWYSLMSAFCDKFHDKQIICLLDHTRLMSKGNEFNEEARISNIMMYANQLARERGVIFIILSQMNRDIEKEKDRRRVGMTPPQLSDIFGASSVEQFATTVLALHRPSMYNVEQYLGIKDVKDLMAVHVLKQREGWTGLVTLKENLKYYEIVDGDYVVER